MITNTYAIYDRGAKCYLPSFQCSADPLAVRSFQNTVNSRRADNAIAQHPEQFALFQLGTFDNEIGAYTNLKLPLILAEGMSLVVDQAETNQETIDVLIERIEALLSNASTSLSHLRHEK